MARFYSNENFPLPAVEELRKLGHDVLTIQETGKADQAMPDEEVLAFAAQEKRTLLTLNRRHFVRLHGQNKNHAGLLTCTYDPDFAALAARIHEAVRERSEIKGLLIQINRPQR